MVKRFISWRTELFAVVLLGTFSALSAYLFDRLPEHVAIHWSSTGIADGWASRSVVVWLFPLIAFAVYAFMLVSWKFDPKRERYIEFAGAYHGVKIMILLFLLSVYALIAINGLGYELPVDVIAAPLVGFLLVGVGTQLPAVKQNWMFGVRTPWTLSSEKVWDRTHRFAAHSFTLGGALAALSAFLPGAVGAVLFFGAIGLAALLPVFYSFIIYWLERSAET